MHCYCSLPTRYVVQLAVLLGLMVVSSAQAGSERRGRLPSDGSRVKGYALEVPQQSITVRGFITDASSGEPLQGANVVFRDSLQQVRGAVSDRRGFYQFTGLEPGTYDVRVSFVGYETYTDTLSLGDRPYALMNVALVPVEEVLGEVVVASEGGMAKVEAGQQVVRPADLARIPTPDAGGDLASYLQSLPSVVSLGDRGGHLFIRGGTPSQNLVLIDGAVVYQPFHIVGFFSAFPQDLVSSVDLYAGGFGARYSGRISSVIDVSMREGNLHEVGGAVTVSPFLVSLRADGPIRKGAVSWLGSVRTSVVEQSGPILIDKSLPFRFGDVFVKLQRAGWENSRCTASALYTYDRGTLDPDAADPDVFRWNNVAVSGRCFGFPKDYPVLFEVNSGVSYVSNQVGHGSSPERSSTALQVNTEVHLSYTKGRTEYGGGFFARSNWLGYRLADQYLNLQNDSELILATGAYLEARANILRTLEVHPGLVLTAYPALERVSLEPRLRMAWRPFGQDGPTTLSAATGLYKQTLTGISDERDAGSAFIAWMSSPVGEEASSALHVLGGWQQRLGPHLRLSVEGFYKRLRHVPVPVWSNVASFTTTLAPANGTVYGADARLEFEQGRIYAYAGYKYSWTRYTTAQEHFSLWFGEPVQHYHPPHDRRHQLNALMSVELGSMSASLRWQFGSGLPYTKPLGFDDLVPLHQLVDIPHVLGIPRVLYAKPYEGRLPAYHRLDVSLERTFPVRFGTLSLQGGVINAYDRANLFYYDVYTVRRVDQLPFLPYVSLKLETR